MRRAMTTSLIGLALLLTAARPASAQWNIIKWLEELSGPGKFTMYGGEVHFGCNYPRGVDAESNQGPKAFRALFCDQNPTPAGSGRVWEQAHLFWTAQLAGGTGSNPLGFDQQDEARDRAWVWSVGAGPSYRICSVVDTGVTLNYTFLSASKTEWTSQVSIEPHVVIRPLANAKVPEGLRQYFGVRLGYSIFPKGFTLDDFGADTGSLDGKAEGVFTVAFVFNWAHLGWGPIR